MSRIINRMYGRLVLTICRLPFPSSSSSWSSSLRATPAPSTAARVFSLIGAMASRDKGKMAAAFKAIDDHIKAFNACKVCHGLLLNNRMVVVLE